MYSPGIRSHPWHHRYAENCWITTGVILLEIDRREKGFRTRPTFYDGRASAECMWREGVEMWTELDNKTQKPLYGRDCKTLTCFCGQMYGQNLNRAVQPASFSNWNGDRLTNDSPHGFDTSSGPHRSCLIILATYTSWHAGYFVVWDNYAVSAEVKWEQWACFASI